jgi:hypothetical protein
VAHPIHPHPATFFSPDCSLLSIATPTCLFSPCVFKRRALARSPRGCDLVPALQLTTLPTTSFFFVRSWASSCGSGTCTPHRKPSLPAKHSQPTSTQAPTPRGTATASSPPLKLWSLPRNPPGVPVALGAVALGARPRASQSVLAARRLRRTCSTVKPWRGEAPAALGPPPRHQGPRGLEPCVRARSVHVRQ